MTKILYSASATALQNALSASTVFAAVEAEYGGVEVYGSEPLLTLNHHIRPELPCPCSIPSALFDSIRERVEAIGVSHCDHDTLGGVMAILGNKPEQDPGFWELVAFVDLNGAHRVQDSPAYTPDRHLRLAAFWSYSDRHPLPRSAPGEVMDVTTYFRDAARALTIILDPEADLTMGREHLAKQEALATASFRHRDITSGKKLKIGFRESDDFVSSLYRDGDRPPFDALVAFSPSKGTVTLSVVDKSIDLDCAEVLRRAYGPEAGGHKNIGGSPRGKMMTRVDALVLYNILIHEH